MFERLKFPKKERLNKKKEIESIFSNGKVCKSYPILISYEISNSQSPKVTVLCTVSKKKQKLAINRNRIKRKLKEAYRLNKLSLFEFSKEKSISINLIIIQVSGDDVPYATIEKKMKKGLSKVLESLAKEN